MKKLIITTVLLISWFMLFAQNAAQTDDMASMKKQISSLKSMDTKFENQLKTIKKTVLSMQDSAQLKLANVDMKMKVLTDSLQATDAQMIVIKESTDKKIALIKKSNTIRSIILILLIICFVVAYLMFSNTIKKDNVKHESEINKLKLDLAETEKKISELKK